MDCVGRGRSCQRRGLDQNHRISSVEAIQRNRVSVLITVDVLEISGVCQQIVQCPLEAVRGRAYLAIKPRGLCVCSAMNLKTLWPMLNSKAKHYLDRRRLDTTPTSPANNTKTGQPMAPALVWAGDGEGDGSEGGVGAGGGVLVLGGGAALAIETLTEAWVEPLGPVQVIGNAVVALIAPVVA